MARRHLQAAIAVFLAAAWFSIAGQAHAQTYGAPGWFSPEPNYYAMPTGPEGLTAALYPSPRPTPPLVGETYITYEPLSPHEYLYIHHQFYRSHNDANQVTRTSVTYGHHLSLHPYLLHGEPGLHTPASTCKF